MHVAAVQISTIGKLLLRAQERGHLDEPAQITAAYFALPLPVAAKSLGYPVIHPKREVCNLHCGKVVCVCRPRTNRQKLEVETLSSRLLLFLRQLGWQSQYDLRHHQEAASSSIPTSSSSCCGDACKPLLQMGCWLRKRHWH